jgi:hypothetical protein
MSAASPVSPHSDYIHKLFAQLWKYAQSDQSILAKLDRQASPDRPPVFQAQHQDFNLLCRPGVDPSEREAIVGAIPKAGRHRWYRSMRSSQALAQSVFANLRTAGQLGLLADVPAEDGGVLVDQDVHELELEHVVGYLGEGRGRETNIDALLTGKDGYRVAIECKLAEDDIGQCSRPELLAAKHKNYERDYCDGSYTVQRGRDSRCSLTSVGIRYWEHAPGLFGWDAAMDHSQCPLRETYQLARNTIAACMDEEGRLDPRRGHAVLLYDERNPAFAQGGSGRLAFERARAALRDPSRLRRATWQSLASRLRGDVITSWLGEALRAKYGFD